MKKILTLVLCWLLAFSAIAETTFKAKTAASVAGGYVTSLNKVDGSFEDGSTQWSASVGTIVPTASTEFQGNNIGVWSGTGAGTLDLQWTATASNTYEASAQVDVQGEDDVYVCAYVGTTETGCKLIPALSKIQKVSVVADSTISSAFYLRLKHTGSDAFSVKVDDGKIEPWTPQAVNLMVQEYLAYSGYSSKNANNQAKFTTKSTKSDNSILISDSNSGDFTKVTALKKCLVNVKFQWNALATTSTSYIYHYGSAGNVIDTASSGRTSSIYSTIPYTAEMNPGDYLAFVNPDGLQAPTNFSITASAISENVVQSWQDGMATWSATSTIQIGATTTAPTKGTNDLDQVKWIKRGESAEFWYQYSQTGAGSAGSGDYLFTLPNGMQFADHVIKYTTLEGVAGWTTGKVGINAGTGWNAGAANYVMFVFPYDNTRFRVAYIGASDASQTGSGVVGSGAAFNMAGSPISFSLKFTVPILGWSSTPTLLALPNGTETNYSITATGNAAQVITANVTDVPFIATTQNNLVWSGSSFTSPTDSIYQVSASINLSANTGNAFEYYINGSRVGRLYSQATGVSSIFPFSTTIAVPANSTFSIRSTVTATLSNTADHRLQITRVNGKIDKTFVGNLNPDGFNRTTGTTGLIDNFSFSYGTTNATTVCSASPCSYLKQSGNYVSQVLRSSSAAYSVTLNKSFSTLICNGNAYVGGRYLAMTPPQCSGSTCTWNTGDATTGYDSYGSIHCSGQ